MITSVRNLTRSFLACSYPATFPEAKDTEVHVKLLIALLFATKNHMRADWGAFSDMSNVPHSPHINLSLSDPEYSDLVPPGLAGYEHKGLGLLLEFTILVEAYIKRGFKRGWWNAPHGSQLTAQLNNLVDAYGKMETIRLTPVPVAHLYALFCVKLPPYIKYLANALQNSSETSLSALWSRSPIRNGNRNGMVGHTRDHTRSIHSLRY